MRAGGVLRWLSCPARMPSRGPARFGERACSLHRRIHTQHRLHLHARTCSICACPHLSPDIRDRRGGAHFAVLLRPHPCLEPCHAQSPPCSYADDLSQLAFWFGGPASLATRNAGDLAPAGASALQLPSFVHAYDTLRDSPLAERARARRAADEAAEAAERAEGAAADGETALLAGGGARPRSDGAGGLACDPLLSPAAAVASGNTTRAMGTAAIIV